MSGERVFYIINAGMRRSYLPCDIEASCADDSDDAAAADRHVFTKRLALSELFLRPGNYRLRAVDDKGRRLSEHTIQLAAR